MHAHHRAELEVEVAAEQIDVQQDELSGALQRHGL